LSSLCQQKNGAERLYTHAVLCCAVLCRAVPYCALQKLRSWIKNPDNDFIIGAGSKGDSDTKQCDGIVSCHAYAVLDIVIVPVSAHSHLQAPRKASSSGSHMQA
jgi:hypothetical protein